MLVHIQLDLRLAEKRGLIQGILISVAISGPA
jgi:hypothetical protein